MDSPESLQEDHAPWRWARVQLQKGKKASRTFHLKPGEETNDSLTFSQQQGWQRGWKYSCSWRQLKHYGTEEATLNNLMAILRTFGGRWWTPRRTLTTRWTATYVPTCHYPLTALDYGRITFLLTASQGGVCKLIGETCCTFIPDEYSTGSDIYEDLQNLTVLQRHVADHTPWASTQDWLAWLTSGPW